jgi:RimJ/RimL family protein N-acetyltransferase
VLQTARLLLQPWGDQHRQGFAALNADPEVMADLGGPLDRLGSDAKFERYRAAFARDGLSRWAVEDREGGFLGYAGVMFRADPGHPLGRHHDVGWRLVRHAWGHGYATEATRAALDHAFGLLGAREILSYTSRDNVRSQAVMNRLSLRRDPGRDFATRYSDVGEWQGLVWVASKAMG